MPRNEPRAEARAQQDYKAIVYILLYGGCDSFNMMVPHSGCATNSTPKDMYQEYKDIRGEIALDNNTLLQINATTPQVCTTFGLHPELPYLKTLYDAGDAIFLANTGVLSRPVTKQDYYLTEFGLSAHNLQQARVQSLDPLRERQSTGVLGRISDAVREKGLRIGVTSLTGTPFAVVGNPSTPTPISYLGGDAEAFNPRASTADMTSQIKNLNNATATMSGLFSETWSQILTSGIQQTEKLIDILGNESIASDFPNSELGNQFKKVVRMINARSTLGTQRDVFYLQMGGYDNHFNMPPALASQFSSVNEALQFFVAELQRQGVWDDVAVVQTSDFGRTLNPNSNLGSDHAWGGQYFVLGGGLDGGKILGKYPDDLSLDADRVIPPRGLVIPDTPWDAVWNGVGEWFGADQDQLDTILPRRNNFDNLFSASDMFESEQGFTAEQ